MSTRLEKFVQKQLQTAKYEYDRSVNQWVGWLPKFEGVYGQGVTVEEVRQKLAEILEEHIFISASENRQVKGFSLRTIVNA